MVSLLYIADKFDKLGGVFKIFRKIMVMGSYSTR
jgi:hypothetical protein